MIEKFFILLFLNSCRTFACANNSMTHYTLYYVCDKINTRRMMAKGHSVCINALEKIGKLLIVKEFRVLEILFGDMLLIACQKRNFGNGMPS